MSLSPNPKPVDAAVRARTLDPTQSFCVSAPAGSGKTELLSQRVLQLLATAEQPEEILAITFTRKAAAEMQERILAALQRAATEPEPTAEHKRQTWLLAKAALARDAALDWKLLQNPQRLRVLTIDGLCASLTRQLPVLSTFGGSVGISDDAPALYRDAVAALFELLEIEHPVADALAALLMHLDNDSERLQRLLVGLLASRDQWLRHIVGSAVGNAVGANSERTLRAELESTLHTIIVEALSQASLQLQRYQGDLLPLLDFAAARLQETAPDHPLAAFAGCVELPAVNPNVTSSNVIAQWQALVSALLTQGGSWRKKVDKRDGFPTGESAANKAAYKARKEAMLALIGAMSADEKLLDVLTPLRHLPAPVYPDSQWQILKQLMVLLPVLAAQLKVVFQQRGEVDYTEVSQAALHALGEAENPGDLLLRLDARLRHILVDEFQDTSSSQFTLLERLVEGWQENNANEARQQTLFIVGDGMQSIYGFRAANVGLFLGARNRGVNGVALEAAALTVNFRSTPTIVQWVNQVFAHAFPSAENIARGAVPYEASDAFNQDRAGSVVRAIGARGENCRALEAEHCVALVQQALAETEGDIAILVRNRGHLRDIVPALGAAGLHWRATDIDPLAARTAVMDMLTLYKALSNLADRISWLALLRTPLVGLDNSDLFTLIAGADGRGRYSSVWSQMQNRSAHARLSVDGVAAIGRAVDVIEAVLARRERSDKRSWLEGAWLALGGPLCLAGDDDWRDVQALFDLIEALPADAGVEQLEARIATLYAKPPVQSGARLWLMTIHKSKGLEFETVIIPGLDRSPRSDDKPLLQWGEYLGADGTSGLVLAPTREFGGEAEAIYDWLDFERKQKQQLEDTRLFYVAATRAISRLYLLFSDKNSADKKSGDKKSEEFSATDLSGVRQDNEKIFAPSSRSLLARIWPAVSESVSWLESSPIKALSIKARTDDAVSNAVSNATESTTQLSRVPPAWRLSLPVSTAFAANADGTNLPENPTRADSVEILAGTLVHALFEQCARNGAEFWQQRDSGQQRTLVELLTRQQGIALAQQPAVVTRVLHALNTALADSRGRWLFDPAHGEAVAEWDLSLEGGRRVVIDRSFVDINGERWIVDYKSSSPRPGENQEDFIARERETYRPQLFGYRDAVASFDARPIRLALYFPSLPAWCEL